MIYIHGKGGNATEAAHYAPLFPDYDVIGLDYQAQTPWDAKEEFTSFYDTFCQEHSAVSIIANSIGAFLLCTPSGQRRLPRHILSRRLSIWNG